MTINLSQVRDDFMPVDVTVVVISYARVHALPALFRALAQQRFEGSWNCILWNNNRSAAASLDRIVADVRGLAIDVFHANRNQFCTVRFAAAGLATGRLILLCDDDVVPGPDFVATFVRKYEHLRSRSSAPLALCACGHRFDRGVVAKAGPVEVWDERRGLSFFDQYAPERMVHFMHANSLLLARELLLDAAAVPMPDPALRLVDDYWMSFVLSHHLKARLLKIRLADSMRFTDSAYDGAVAMHLQPAVREAKLLMYQHHQRCGWPS